MKKSAIALILLLAFVACLAPVRAADEAEIEQAIVDGLVWLASQQEPTDGWWGNYSDRRVGITGLAVKKFEHDAMLKGYPSPLDPSYPYHDVVQKGLNFLFANANIVSPLPVQTAGDPDTDGNGMGLTFGSHLTYETSIALMAIA